MTAMTDRTLTDAEARAMLAAALQTVAVECVHYDCGERPKRRRLMPLGGLLAPVEGLVSPGLPGGLRDAS